MVVKLSRFVRVMSGGLIVTDELVTVREAKVNAELALLQAEIDRLNATGLPIPAIPDSLRTLTAARDSALGQGSNKDICEALEDVKFDVRDAVTDATPQVDEAEAAVQERTAKLGFVDTAMAGLRQTEGSITVPAYKTPISGLIPPLKRRRDDLANAADVAGVQTQVGLAPALLIDIGKAEKAAAANKLKAEQFTTRTASIDQSVNNSNSWIACLKAGSDGQLKLDRDKLVADRAALNTTALAGMDAALTAAERGASKLFDDATAEAAKQMKTNADTWLPAFVAWETRIGKITAHNPIHAEVVALRQEKTNAEALTDSGARRNALSTFTNNAGALQTKVLGMEAGKKEIERVGMTIQALLTLKPPPTPGPVALARERADELAKIPAAFNLATADLVIAQLATLKVNMLAIKQKAEDWRAGQLGLDKQKASTAQSLAEARIAVDLLTDGAGKTKLDDALKALIVRKTAADTMPEAEANKALFALNKEALALLEQAHMQVFSDQLGSPDGKKKVDDAIKDLGATAANPQAEAKCRAALAARFKIDIDVLEGLSVDRLPQLYEMFALVPEGHVGHDKLTKLEYNTDASLSASYYQGAGNKIVLWMPGSERDAPYKPQSGGGAVENLNYFKATTLHEIGHAVDTKQGIMSASRMAGADFGGWKKETIATVVDAYYTNAFASFVASSGPTEVDLRAFAKAVLETGDCKKPASATVALGSLFAKWDDIYASDGFKNCKKIRNPDTQPWDSPVPVGTRAYHEGYGGDWFSYLVASRDKGVSNYQWRAPPEWFAELYAYYHMTKKDVPASVKGFIMGTETASPVGG